MISIKLFADFYDKLVGRRGADEVRERSDQIAAQATLDIGSWAALHIGLQSSDATPEQRRQVCSAVLKGFEGKISDEKVAKAIVRALRCDADSARQIAQTDLTRIAGFAAWRGARRAGFKRKIWMTSQDHVVRSTHAAMDGQVRAIDEPFTSPSGATAMFPGEFGIAAEDDACRCAMRAAFPGE